MRKSIIISLMLLLNNYSDGCSCLETNLKDEIQKVNFICSGRIVEIITPSYGYANDSVGTKVRVLLIKSYKGEFAKDTIDVDATSSSCSFNFILGREYLIFGDQNSSEYFTNLCTRTSILENNSDIVFLENK